MKRQTLKRVLASVLGLSMILPNVPMQVYAQEPTQIEIEEVSAKSHSAHGADYIKDGSTSTYWQSIPSNGEGDSYKMMYSHNRYIDITLDGMYNLSEVKIFNNVDDSFNNYYVYASTDGVNYDKIISKTSNDKATAEGDSYDVNVEASHLRLNMAYNSKTFATNLAEIELYGIKTGERQDDTTGIQVSDWEGSEWQKEWDKFETDETYAKSKILLEMKNLVGRVIGDEWKDDFIFQFRGTLQDEKDIFEVKSREDGKIIIYGNNGMAMAAGFNYYLKNYVNVDFNPLFGSNVAMKEIVPMDTPVVKEAQYNLRYALNFCTYSYTMAFWNWDEYEEFLDWAAMNGINLILDIVGQEEVLRQTFLEYGFTEDEIKDYICGPAYYAWFYMQNLYSVGGPLPDSWFEERTELGRRIHDRMQVFSIDPVLQGFAGQVPETFPEKNPGAKLAPLDGWSGHTRPSLLMTYVNAGETDYFPEVAKTFYEKQKNVFGDITDYYATDPFHEDGKTGGLDTATIFQVVQQKMMESNPDAVWVMQQWQRNLDATKMSKMDKDHALALYLQADMAQRGSYKNEEMVFENNGTPWIYNMLHNFGGRMGLDGEIPWISENPMTTFQSRNNMVGIGITPEALENSPVIYELFWETLWSKDPIDYRSWLEQYARRRAGGDSESLQQAWEILLETAYANKKAYIQGAAETIMNARPADTFPKGASTWGHSNIEYEKDKVDEALRLLAENYEEFKESEAFRYDLAEVAEQVICNVAIEYHGKMVAAKNAKNLDQFTYYSDKFLSLFDLAEQVLSSTDEFMLGTWIEAARKMIPGADDWTKDLFEYNARSLLTTWGGENAAVNGKLKDYSNRKWAGLTSSFYKERWNIWIRNRKADIQGVARNPEDDKAENNWFLWEYQWNNRKSDDENGKYGFSTTVTNTDLGTLGKQIYDQYSYTAFLKEGESNQALENALKGIVPSLEGNASSGELKNLTDGSAGEGWVAEGTGNQVLTFELGKTYELKTFVISLLQLAKEFPYGYKLESFNPDENKWEVIEEYAQNSMGSNHEINTGETYVSNKLRLTMNTTDDVNSPLTITEFAAYGVPVDTAAETYVNLVQGMDPVINVKTASDSAESNLTDGSTSTLWKTPWVNGVGYAEGYPAIIELDLTSNKYVDHIQLHFESAGRPFQFTVSVNNAKGETKEVSAEYKEHNDTLPESSFTIPVKEDINKVIMTFVGTSNKGQYAQSTPAMTEIMVMGKESEVQENTPIKFTSGKIEGINVQGGNATNNIKDGNKGTFDKVTNNTEIVFTLPETYYAKEAQVTFEKGVKDAPNNDALSIRYQLLGEDQDGNRFMILDKGTTDELLPEKTITIPINEAVKKLIFIHKGNSGKGNAYAAEARIYEFEVYGGEPDNNISDAQLQSDVGSDLTALTDGKTETTYKVKEKETITVTLPSEAEVRFVSVEKKSEATGSLSYVTEYYDNETGSWKNFCSAGSETENKVYGQGSEKVFTDKLRFIFSAELDIAELGIYITDYSLSVNQEITEARNKINGLTYGEYSGEYSAEAKAELEAVLQEIESRIASGVDAKEAEVYMEELKQAVDRFNKHSIVYISRDNILLSLVKALRVIEGLNITSKEEALATLQPVFDETLDLYNTYRVTQKQLDDQAALLLEEAKKYEAQIPAEDIKYLILFDSNGGNSVEAQFTKEGERAEKPEDPVLEGYIFKGWFIGDTEYDFGSEVSSDLVLVAKWEKEGTGSTDGDVSDNTPGDGDVSDNTPGDGDVSDNTPGDGDVSDNTPGDGDVSDNMPGDGDVSDNTPGDGDGSDNEPGDGDGTEKYLTVYAVTNIAKTLKDVVLPEGYKWYDDTVDLTAFAGLNEKAFAAFDEAGNQEIVIVRLSTIQNLELISRAGSNKTLKAGIGKSEDLLVAYDVIGEPLKDFEMSLKVTADSKKGSVDYTTSGNDTVTIIPKQAGSAVVTVELTHDHKTLISKTQKVSVVDTAKKGIAALDIVLVDKDNQPLTMTKDGLYVVKAGEEIYLQDNTDSFNGKAFKVKFKTSDSNVVKLGKTNGTKTQVTAVQAGFALITATAADAVNSSCELKLQVRDDSIKLGNTAITLNTAMAEPEARVRIYTGFEAASYEAKLDGKVADCDKEGIITIKDATKGKHTLQVIVTGMDGTVYPQAEFALTVKEVSKKPVITIKQVSKLNSQYKDGYAVFTVGAAGEEITDVTVNGLKAGEDYTYDAVNGILTIKNISNDKGKEVVKVIFADYAAQEKGITVAQQKESFRLSSTKATLYKELEGQCITLQLLNNTTKLPEEDMEVKVTTLSGDGSYQAVVSGNHILVESTKLPTNKDKVELIFSSENWRNDISQILNISAADLAKASLQLGKKSVTLYNYVGYGDVISSTETPLTLKGGSALEALLSLQGYELTITEGKNKVSAADVLSVSYEDGKAVVRKTGEGLTAGRYKCDITLTGSSFAKPLKTTLSIKVVNVNISDKTAATAALKAAGSIDVLNRKGTSITLRGSFKNVDQNVLITKIRLIGRDAHLFEIVKTAGKDVTIQLKDEFAVITKYSYQVSVEYTLQWSDTTFVLESNPAAVKLTFKKPKISIVGLLSAGNSFREAEKLDIVVVNSAKVRVAPQMVELINFTKDFTYDNEAGILIHNAAGETAIGKSYTLKIAVYPQGAGDNESPVTASYKVKIVK